MFEYSWYPLLHASRPNLREDTDGRDHPAHHLRCKVIHQTQEQIVDESRSFFLDSGSDGFRVQWELGRDRNVWTRVKRVMAKDGADDPECTEGRVGIEQCQCAVENGECGGEDGRKEQDVRALLHQGRQDSQVIIDDCTVNQ